MDDKQNRCIRREGADVPGENTRNIWRRTSKREIRTVDGHVLSATVTMDDDVMTNENILRS